MKEFDVVRLKIDAFYDAKRKVIPKGTKGTIVHIYPLIPMTEGRIFEVEFSEHKQVLSINELWLEE